MKKNASVLAISDDGNLATGMAFDPATGQDRAWLWTVTEGLGWLDEWLHNHGVNLSDAQKENLHVQFLSADRRALFGYTVQEGSRLWWRVDMPEKCGCLCTKGAYTYLCAGIAIIKIQEAV